MVNLEVRDAAIQHRVKLWEVADMLGMTDSSFSRKLRKELSEEDRARVLEIIESISKGVQ